MAWFQKKTSGSAAAPKAGSSPRPLSAMKIGPLLDEAVVLFPSEGQGKDAVLEALVAAVCRKAGIADGAAFLAKVQERERGISTTLDTGLSLPHARVDGLDSILAGMAVLKKPIPDPRPSDPPIRVMFLFFSPSGPEAFPLHLQLLRGIAAIFQPDLIDRLTAAATPAAALELVRALEA